MTVEQSKIVYYDEEINKLGVSLRRKNLFLRNLKDHSSTEESFLAFVESYLGRNPFVTVETPAEHVTQEELAATKAELEATKAELEAIQNTLSSYAGIDVKGELANLSELVTRLQISLSGDEAANSARDSFPFYPAAGSASFDSAARSEMIGIIKEEEIIISNIISQEAQDIANLQSSLSSLQNMLSSYAQSTDLSALTIKEAQDIANLQSSLSSYAQSTDLSALDESVQMLDSMINSLGLRLWLLERGGGGDGGSGGGFDTGRLGNVESEISSVESEISNIISKEAQDIANLQSSIAQVLVNVQDQITNLQAQDLTFADKTYVDATYQTKGDYAVNSALDAAKQSATDALNAAMTQAASTYQVQGDYAVNSDVDNLQSSLISLSNSLYALEQRLAIDESISGGLADSIDELAKIKKWPSKGGQRLADDVSGIIEEEKVIISDIISQEAKIANLQSSLSSLQNIVNSITGLDEDFTSQIEALQATLAALGFEVGDVTNQSSIAQVLVNVQDQITNLQAQDLTFADKTYVDATYQTKGDYAVNSALDAAKQSATDALNAYMTQVASTYQVQGDYAAGSDVTNLQNQALTFAAQSYVDAIYQKKGDYVVNSDLDAVADGQKEYIDYFFQKKGDYALVSELEALITKEASDIVELKDQAKGFVQSSDVNAIVGIVPIGTVNSFYECSGDSENDGAVLPSPVVVGSNSFAGKLMAVQACSKWASQGISNTLYAYDTTANPSKCSDPISEAGAAYNLCIKVLNLVPSTIDESAVNKIWECEGGDGADVSMIKVVASGGTTYSDFFSAITTCASLLNYGETSQFSNDGITCSDPMQGSDAYNFCMAGLNFVF